MKQMQEQAPVLHPSIYQLAESEHLGTLQEAYTVPGNPVSISLGTFFLGGLIGIPLVLSSLLLFPPGQQCSFTLSR